MVRQQQVVEGIEGIHEFLFACAKFGAIWPASICVACYTHGPDTDAKKHVVYSFFYLASHGSGIAPEVR